MKKQDKEQILERAAELAGGIDAAIHEHLTSPAVMVMTGGEVPAGADLNAIAAIRDKHFVDKRTSPKSKAGKSVPRTSQKRMLGKAKPLSRMNQRELFDRMNALKLPIEAPFTNATLRQAIRDKEAK